MNNCEFCATSSGQDSAVHVHLKESGQFFEDNQVRVLERDHWFKRGVKGSHPR